MFWWLLLLLMMMMTQSGLSTHGVCEPIRIEMCQRLGYNVTTMPNLVGHELQTDADFTLKTFKPLIEYGCSGELPLFLCSVYVPMCTEKVPSPIGPCRGLCEQVRDQCYPVLEGFGFPWPAALNCSKFPPKNDHQHMCMEGPGKPGPMHSKPIGGCTGYAYSDKYIIINRTGRCAPICDANILWSTSDKQTTETWMTILVIISLVSCVTAVVRTFMPATSRSSTGETAIKWLTICHVIVAIGYLVRVIVGRTNIACSPTSTSLMSKISQEQIIHQQHHLTQDGLSNAYCAIVFIFHYYFGSVASAWWVVVCGWCYQSIKKSIRISDGKGTKDDFGPEKGCSKLGAFAAWILPGVHTLAVFITRDVDADELTGSCFAGQQKTRSLLFLVLIPQFLYITIGLTFLICGLATMLFRRPPIKTTIQPQINQIHTNPLVRQRELRSPIDNQRQQKWLLRHVCGFALTYLIIMILLLCITTYEWLKRDSWLVSSKPTDTKYERSRPSFYIFLFKLTLTLGSGAVAALWILLPSITNILCKISPYKQSPQKCYPQQCNLSVTHCYTPTSTTSLPHQNQHLGYISPSFNSHYSHNHQRSMSLPHRSHKKPRKHRKYHSGSETQV
ncbi:hypothetical protein HCN44_005606 [Aphidius gifuensis]|uniref:Frizzled-4 n=1 Tax=Aphidius gifuensis TaxID=684658 RepID=A0A834Y528_APHGI|nr:frizzled-4 [Aphidius gifuensis]KAF7997329.1 hypothetical protein HCN44_005606 [Aphidius gifuensis]